MKIKLKYHAFERELKDIMQNFIVISINYDSSKDFASITYTDGYIVMSIVYEYIEQINFWSIKEIF